MCHMHRESRSTNHLICQELHFSPLKTQALAWDSNPGQDELQAASPGDQGATCLCFFGIKFSLIQTVDAIEDEGLSVNAPMVAPTKRHNQLPNEGK